MASNYLDKFRSTLPVTQGNQLLKRLLAKRDSGEIRTVDEFKARLRELTAELLEKRIKPTFKLFEAVAGEDISSEQYNEMLERIHDDLEAAFSEADNIDEIVSAHRNLIDDVALKAIEFGVNELESRINLYEFLNRSGDGFDSALFNTFRESETFALSRSSDDATLVYIDPRATESIGPTEEALIDLVGERLTMGTSSAAYVSVREAEWLFNRNSVQSELDVRFDGSDVNNIIDGTSNTYWVVPVLSSTIRTGGMPMEVALKTNASQDINFIDIEPATEFPMYLAQIDYLDSNYTRQTVSSDLITLSGPTRVNFERITTKTLILRFRQDNYKEVQFKPKLGTSNFHRAVLSKNNFTVDMESVSDDLYEMLSSDFMLSDIMNVPTNTNTVQKYFEYVLGFDNIRPGFNRYNNRAIFVSVKKEVDYPGQFGLRVDEQRPVQVGGSTSVTIADHSYPSRSTDEDNRFYHSVPEYWLTLKFYSDDDYLIATDTVPILPIGAKRIYHEQLIFTHKSAPTELNPNQGSLRFYCDEDSSDVRVYRNNTLLTYGDTEQWRFVPATGADANSDLTLEVAAGGSRMKRGIWIVGGVRPLDIYTVSYTPKTSNTRILPADSTLFDLVDLVGDQSIRMIRDNLITVDGVRKSQAVARADVYLSILMRLNSANDNFSTIIEEYMLLTGSRNLEKFVSDV